MHTIFAHNSKYTLSCQWGWRVLAVRIRIYELTDFVGLNNGSTIYIWMQNFDFP
jgi:hypothetical protein